MEAFRFRCSLERPARVFPDWWSRTVTVENRMADTTVAAAALGVYDIGYYVMAAFCLRHARRSGWREVAVVLAAILYGYLVEFSGVASLPHRYHYDTFLIRLPGAIPLGAVLGWGIIFYATRLATQRMAVRAWAAPAMAALLAVLIDLVLDPVTVHVGFWTWTETVYWFGIPWNNYAGWLVVIASLTAAEQVTARLIPAGSGSPWRDYAAPVLAVVPAFAAYVALMYGYMTLLEVTGMSETLLISSLLGAGLIVVLSQLRGLRRDQPLDPLALAIPAYFYGWSIITLFLTGLHAVYPAFAVAGPLIALLGTLGFAWPYLNQILGDGASAGEGFGNAAGSASGTSCPAIAASSASGGWHWRSPPPGPPSRP